MKFKDFVFSNSKKIIGSALLLSLMAVQTVGATGGITDSLKSKGNIEYDANGDGQADVYFYSKDLTTIAGGVEDINSNMAILSQSFTDLTTASNGYKSDIIAGLNSNVYAKNNIPADSTFEDIISKINNIPAPTTATGNVWSSGDNSGIGITSNGQSVNIDGVTSLNLAVNESVTLPSGYYPNDITISNNVANRGSLSFNPSGSSTNSVSSGYYSGGTLSSSSAYNNGYASGYSEGKAAGRKEGYDEGKEDGYEEGHDAGANEPHTTTVKISVSGSLIKQKGESGSVTADYLTATINVGGQTYNWDIPYRKVSGSSDYWKINGETSKTVTVN